MGMGFLDGIEKVITEHGSAAILNQQLAFARDQYAALERQVTELQSKAAKLEAHLEIERTNYAETKQELQRLKDEHAEEIRIHRKSGVEFRRGKRTGGDWSPFCPSCHSPAASFRDVDQLRCQSKTCGLNLLVFPQQLPGIYQELSK